ncbi:MAG: hypothetical protein KBS60_01340 [Phascolarctobacterium sp.]|nr:hypothetical protein [Candidatus Phascolarctobacterium caballi]
MRGKNGNDFDKMNKECGFEEIEEYCKLFIPPMVLDAIRDLQIQIVRNTRVKVVIEGWK